MALAYKIKHTAKQECHFSDDCVGQASPVTIKATVAGYPNFHSRVKAKKGYTSRSRLRQGGTPNYYSRVKAKKGYTSRSRLRQEGTPNFHSRIKAKKGYTSHICQKTTRPKRLLPRSLHASYIRHSIGLFIGVAFVVRLSLGKHLVDL